jgi:hypothetical protein
MRHREHISALAADEKQAAAARLMRSRAAFRFSQHARERERERAAYARCDQIIHRPGALLFYLAAPVRSNK